MSLTPATNTARPEDETNMQSGSDYSHSQNLAYLINEVYRSRIIQVVDFGVLISYMPFMNEILPQVYNLRKTNPKEAANIFFEHLKNVEEEGKYQSFVDALRRARYPLLVAALESNEIISNDHEHNQLINLFVDKIAMTIDVEKMSEELQMKEVITAEEGEQIRKTARYNGNFDASFELLFKIPHRAIDWYTIFLESLYENRHLKLLKEIDVKFYEKKMESENVTNGEVVAGEKNDSGCDVSDALYSTVSVSVAADSVLQSSPVSPAANPVSQRSPVSPAANPVSQRSPVSPAANPVSQRSPVNPAANPVSQRSPVSPANDSRPQTETKSISVEFGERVLSELSELKLLVQAQTHGLQALISKTDLLVERVNSLEQKLERNVNVRDLGRNVVSMRDFNLLEK